MSKNSAEGKLQEELSQGLRKENTKYLIPNIYSIPPFSPPKNIVK